MSMIKIMVLSLSLATFFSAYAGHNYENVRDGNSYFDNNNYKDAELSYRKAIDAKEGVYAPNYNLGNALYRQGNAEGSIEHYKAAITKDNSKKENASLYHNLGNAYFEKQDYQNAVNSYKQSLKYNPKDEDTRYNLALAKEKLVQQQQQQQQQQAKQEQQDQNQQHDENSREENNDEQNSQNAPERDRKMDQEQAQQILDALDNDEKERQKEKVNQMKAKNVRIEKDW